MQISDIYKALSDESRLRILNALQFGVFNVQELTSLLELTQPTISHHLKILSSAGLVSVEKTGTWAFYRLVQDESLPISGSIIQNLLKLLQSNELQSNGSTFKSDSTQIKKLLDSRRDKAKAFFDSAASQWKTLRSEIQGDASYFDEVQSLISSTESVLELGCGGGVFLDAITPRKGKTIAVDYSDAMLESAKKLLGKKADHIDFRLGYLEHLPIGDESVEVAISYMVLHHISDPRLVLSDTIRALKPGGKLIIVELSKHSNEHMRDKFSDLWLGFNPSEMKSWASDAGFEKVETEFLDSDKKVFLLKAFKK